MSFSRRTSWERLENALAIERARLEQAGQPLIDLTETNPTRVLAAPQEMAEALARAPLAPYRPEPFGLPEARAALAADLAARGGPSAGELVLTASTSEAYAFVFALLGDPGDRVLAPRPSYPLFEYLAQLSALELGHYELELETGFGLDLDSLARAIDARTRAVLVVHPGNPTGTFLRESEWRALDALCAERGVALVCDEVFLDYAFADAPGRMGSLAGARPRALTFVLSGLSKRCGLPQLKLGWMSVHGPEEQVREAYARLELIADTFLSVGAPVQAALPALLPLGARVRDELRARVRENRRRLERAIPSAAPYGLVASEGGWSALVRLPGSTDEESLALVLLRAGVVVQPGYFFDFPRGRFLALSLLPPGELFTEGLSRLIATLDSELAR
jgi:alanine-synthesizing transaminase